jgi:hypothetical protein
MSGKISLLKDYVRRQRLDIGTRFLGTIWNHITPTRHTTPAKIIKKMVQCTKILLTPVIKVLILKLDKTGTLWCAATFYHSYKNFLPGGTQK